MPKIKDCSCFSPFCTCTTGDDISSRTCNKWFVNLVSTCFWPLKKEGNKTTKVLTEKFPWKMTVGICKYNAVWLLTVSSLMVVVTSQIPGHWQHSHQNRHPGFALEIAQGEGQHRIFGSSPRRSEDLPKGAVVDFFWQVSSCKDDWKHAFQSGLKAFRLFHLHCYKSIMRLLEIHPSLTHACLLVTLTQTWTLNK